MKPSHLVWTVFAIILWFGQLAYSGGYLVVFQHEAPTLGALEHEALEEYLLSTNGKPVADLEKFLTGRRETKTVENLWLVHGAYVDVSPETAEELKKQPFVMEVIEDFRVSLVEPMNDLEISDTIGDEATALWGVDRIGYRKIQQEFPKINGTGVRVGIIDTGIQAKHPVFGGVPSNPQFKDFVVGLSEDPYDDHGHGTHVAGTIAGSRRVGLAPGAKLIVAKALSAQGYGYTSWLVRAMQWMFDPDGKPNTADYAQVVSNSWGASLYSAKPVIDIRPFLPFAIAVDNWVRAGIIPVFAAGNSYRAPNGIPAGFANAIAVGAINRTNMLAPFSSRGPNIWRQGIQVLSLFKPDISAPGVAVTSAFPGNKYATWSGTSMATPHVTGSIALALQVNSKLKFAHIKDLLLSTCERKVDLGFGYGIINAYNLVKAAGTYVPTR